MQIDIEEIKLILSGVKLLQDLDVSIIDDIAEHIDIVMFEKGEKIVTYGEKGECLFIIFNGEVEVKIPESKGKKKKNITLKKGSVFGEFSLLSENTKNSADVYAKYKTVTLTISKPNFLSLIKHHDSFAKEMTNLMGSRLVHNEGLTQIGKYLLKGRLGEGAMSIVFDGYDKILEREVAIKMLKFETNYQEEFFKRFEIEAKTIARLNHPYIINVIEIIDEFSTRFIVMEKLKGSNLADIQKAKGSFSVEETKEILTQLASALQYAHHQGIVHRDIKPSNVILDSFNNIKLNDFGLARPPLSRSINIEGSPLYLAPEIIKGDAVDGRADIYALGVMAFHMLSARLPFNASTLDSLLEQQVYTPAPDISDICPEIDEKFAHFINKALEKDVSKRISDWDLILKLLKPVQTENTPKVKKNEVGIFIRLNNTPFKQTSSLLQYIEKYMESEGIDNGIELILPSKDKL